MSFRHLTVEILRKYLQKKSLLYLKVISTKNGASVRFALLNFCTRQDPFFSPCKISSAALGPILPFWEIFQKTWQILLTNIFLSKIWVIPVPIVLFSWLWSPLLLSFFNLHKFVSHFLWTPSFLNLVCSRCKWAPPKKQIQMLNQESTLLYWS